MLGFGVDKRRWNMLSMELAEYSPGKPHEVEYDQDCDVFSTNLEPSLADMYHPQRKNPEPIFCFEDEERKSQRKSRRTTVEKMKEWGLYGKKSTYVPKKPKISEEIKLILEELELFQDKS